MENVVIPNDSGHGMFDPLTGEATLLPLTLPLDIDDYEDPNTLAARVVALAVKRNYRLQVTVNEWLTPSGPIRYISHVSDHNRLHGGLTLKFAFQKGPESKVVLSGVRRGEFLATLDTTTVDEDTWTIERGPAFPRRDPVVAHLQKIFTRLSERGEPSRWWHGLYALCGSHDFSSFHHDYLFEAIGPGYEVPEFRRFRVVPWTWKSERKQDARCECWPRWVRSDLPLFVSANIDWQDRQAVRTLWCKVNPAITRWRVWKPRTHFGIISCWENGVFRDTFVDDHRFYPQIRPMPYQVARPLYPDELIGEFSWF